MKRKHFINFVLIFIILFLFTSCQKKSLTQDFFTEQVKYNGIKYYSSVDSKYVEPFETCVWFHLDPDIDNDLIEAGTLTSIIMLKTSTYYISSSDKQPDFIYSYHDANENLTNGVHDPQGDSFLLKDGYHMINEKMILPSGEAFYVKDILASNDFGTYGNDTEDVCTFRAYAEKYPYIYLEMNIFHFENEFYVSFVDNKTKSFKLSQEFVNTINH